MVVTKVSSTTALKSCCWLRLGGICLPSRLARELLLEIKAWSPAVWKCTAVRHCVNPPFPNVCWAKNWTTVPDKRHKGNRIKIPGAKMKKKKKTPSDSSYNLLSFHYSSRNSDGVTINWSDGWCYKNWTAAARGWNGQGRESCYWLYKRAIYHIQARNIGSRFHAQWAVGARNQ
jgi:hypothetical protein